MAHLLSLFRLPAAVRGVDNQAEGGPNSYEQIGKSTVSSLVEKRFCPHCKYIYSENYLGLSDGLGSRLFACGKCGKSFTSGLSEWRHMTLSAQVRYCGISVLYSLMAGLQTATIAFVIAMYLPNGGPGEEFFELIFSVGFMIGATAMALLQLWRAKASLNRTRNGAEPLLTTRFFSLHTNLHTLAGVTLLTVAALAFLTVWLLHKQAYGSK
jgi:ABC-type sugar transport system permease subunit